MFCQKCGKEVGKEAKFCGFCGNELINEEIKNFDQNEKFNIDNEGFVRKSRNSIGILFWIIGGIIGMVSMKLPGEFDAIGLVLWPVTAYFLYLAIKNYSSHVIETWEYSAHTRLWIFVGCLIAGLLGIVIYYYLKGKEREYLAKKHIQHLD